MKEKGWKDLPLGGKILEAGNAREYKTGGWKTFRPNIDRAECINCLFCWIYCPDMAITLESGAAVKNVRVIAQNPNVIGFTNLDLAYYAINGGGDFDKKLPLQAMMAGHPSQDSGERSVRQQQGHSGPQIVRSEPEIRPWPSCRHSPGGAGLSA